MAQPVEKKRKKNRFSAKRQFLAKNLEHAVRIAQSDTPSSDKLNNLATSLGYQMGREGFPDQTMTSDWREFSDELRTICQAKIANATNKITLEALDTLVAFWTVEREGYLDREERYQALKANPDLVAILATFVEGNVRNTDQISKHSGFETMKLDQLLGRLVAIGAVEFMIRNHFRLPILGRDWFERLKNEGVIKEKKEDAEEPQ